ncbi:MAG: stage III sporulation protein AE [bacterium]|nr:stage III sporulation protein AE [bacterium]MDY4098941.1 stage III sporulation protein AE [Lachnospiraceae bacterium]
MKGRGKRLCVRLVLLLILMQPVCVQAAGAVQETTRLQTSEVGQEAKAAQEAAYIQAADASAGMTEETDQMTDELLEELELDEMERFLSEQQGEDDLNISFGELIKGFLSGEETFDVSRIWSWVVAHCFSAVRQNKTYLIQMLILLLAFAMLQGISGIFAGSFLSEISFLAVYFLFLYNALRIFASMQQIVYSCMDRVAEFTLLVQPVFCMAMIFSAGMRSAGLTYEMLLLVLYLVQNILQKLLLPIVFLFLITQFANYAWKEEHFSNMAKLFEGAVTFSQKLLVTAVLGMNLIQGMVAPAVDQLKKTAAVRTIGVIPGLGGAMNAVSEMLLGTGLLIKNCVGASVIVVLILLCAKPLLEIGMLALIYRVLAALAEPVTDKRVSGVLDALARAGMLYLKLVVTAILMLFLTVAVVCVATHL